MNWAPLGEMGPLIHLMGDFNKEKPNETQPIKGYAVRLVPFIREQKGQPFIRNAASLAVPQKFYLHTIIY